MLLQTFALASAQVFALALDTYFQLTIMLMILVVGFAVLSHLRPFEAAMSQTTQVSSCQDTLAPKLVSHAHGFARNNVLGNQHHER